MNYVFFIFTCLVAFLKFSRFLISLYIFSGCSFILFLVVGTSSRPPLVLIPVHFLVRCEAHGLCFQLIVLCALIEWKKCQVWRGVNESASLIATLTAHLQSFWCVEDDDKILSEHLSAFKVRFSCGFELKTVNEGLTFILIAYRTSEFYLNIEKC